MKFFVFLLAIILVFVSSCKKKDLTPPYIFLKGDNPMIITLGSTFQDPGASADDNFDGASISTKILSNYNIPNTNNVTSGDCITNEHGDWVVKYTVSDNADNKATKTRIVKVRNTSAKYAIDYTFNKTGDINIFINFSGKDVKLEVDKRVNNRILFPKISNNEGFKIYADIIGDSIIDIPEQNCIFVENNDSVLYTIRGDQGLSMVTNLTNSFRLKISYQLEMYKLSTSDDFDYFFEKKYWKFDKNSSNTEDYVQKQVQL